MSVNRLRATQLTADTTKWVAARPDSCEPDPLVGQQRAVDTVGLAQKITSPFSHMFAATPPGLLQKNCFKTLADLQSWPNDRFSDWVYLANPEDPNAPISVRLPAGTAERALTELWDYLNESPENRQQRYADLITQYATPEFTDYLNLIKDKTFDDLPGQELANVIVSHTEPSPLYFCDHVTAESLFGDIRLQSIQGTISTELHLIRPGALLKANGGTLVLDAAQLLIKPELWHRLKQILRHRLFEWQLPGTSQTAIYYEPQPIPIDVKVILTGSRELFGQLKELDRDFTMLFPYLADFTVYFPTHKLPVSEYFGYLKFLKQTTGHRALHDNAWQALLQLSSELTDHQQELSLDSVRMMQLLNEADSLAEADGSGQISALHLHAARKGQRDRERQIAELSWQSILEHQVKIETSGSVTGQINGLTVVTMAGFEFGEPSRITATVHHGDGDIIDIERKADLSGSIHTKGIMILTAFLANLFAKQEAMSLSATLVFEQSYHEVDGDSASLAELCCLVSALADTPLKQAIAVTGAIDQFGNVQSVGGINEKIHGFYEICKARGLDGSHKVIIPATNLINLHLSDEVQQAVDAQKFSVIIVEHAFEAFEVLMEFKVGELSDFDSQSLFGRINTRLSGSQSVKPGTLPWWKRLLGSASD